GQRRSDRELLAGGRPRVRSQGAHGETDPCPPAGFAGFDLDHFHLDHLTGLEDLRRVGDARVAELPDVNQSLDLAEIDEGPDLLSRAHPSLQDGADLDALPRFGSLLRGFFFEQRAARDDDVAAAGLDLGDAEAQPLADVAGGIATPPIDLRPGAEGA